MDKLYITIPKETSFSNEINCTPGLQVLNITCSKISQRDFSVLFTSVNKTVGLLSFNVTGIINPPNFRKSSAFSNIYSTDALGWKS